MFLITVNGEPQALETRTYEQAVKQMQAALGMVDEAGAAAWYIRFYEHFQATGLSYQRFLQAFREGRTDAS